MSRTKGAVNYKNEMLINIISEILPNGEYGWQAVSFAYHEQSKEDQARNTDDLKRHWIKTLCNGMKKPTGKPGGPKDRIHRCISIEKKILNKTHSGMLGLSSSDGEDDEEDDAPSRGGMDDDLFGEEAEIVGGGGSMSHLNQHKMSLMVGIQMLMLRVVICLLPLVLLLLFPLSRCRIQQVTSKSKECRGSRLLPPCRLPPPRLTYVVPYRGQRVR
jgi:hypothetical protein